MYTQRAVADRDGIFFPLLSDFWPHGETAKAYGVFDEISGGPKRSSFARRQGRNRALVGAQRHAARDATWTTTRRPSRTWSSHFRPFSDNRLEAGSPVGHSLVVAPLVTRDASGATSRFRTSRAPEPPLP